ncbi:MAG TPA: methylenetetrahydrofolate reductase C-terminal domain-containing protein [Syntrophorhabdales bacterium]|nr:methylenetetrahydrofolate reductase C-terminal domain-containing protein [Syntrophorhabdales bacterium]
MGHPGGFVYTLELVPGRGSRGKTQDEILRTAEQAARGGLINAVSLTDNPGGHPTLFPDVIGLEICRLGIDPIVHFTCKDKNRNQIESILYELDRIGIHNLLVMTGDYPRYGFEGQAKPVCDLDSVQAIRLISQMNQGLELDGRAPGGGLRLPPTHTFKGAAISSFKQLESEVMAQYFKMSKKVRMGADFLITQVGFDARKFDELLRYMRLQGLGVPVLGNVYVLNLPVARAMHQKLVPGCVVTDELFKQIEKEAVTPDHGKEAGLTRAAKMIAVLKGIGYTGVHIGGPHLEYEDVERIIKQSKEFSNGWQEFVVEFSLPQKDGFYLFEKNNETGLNTDVLAARKPRPRKRLGHGIMRTFHRLVFAPEAPLYGLCCSFFRKIDGTRLEGPTTEIEYWIKFISSRCRRCGDCTLAEVAFLCPQSQCPKFLFNGQCGGSSEGWCEVFPGKRRCIYVRAYERLRTCDQEESLRGEYIRPRDWALDQTSSWTNYFLGRDHRREACEDPDGGKSRSLEGLPGTTRVRVFR